MKNTVNCCIVSVGITDEFQLRLCVLQEKLCVCISQNRFTDFYMVRDLYQTHPHVPSFSKSNLSQIGF